MISPTGISNKKTGFTLIEILLVLLILGIVAGLSLPNLGRTYNAILLNRTANDLASLIRYAQSRAIIQRQAFQLTLNPGMNQYRLQKEDSSVIPGRLGRVFKVPSRIQVLAQNPTMHFQPDGKIEKIRWSLCDKKDCLTISTKEQSGYVHIFEGTDL